MPGVNVRWLSSPKSPAMGMCCWSRKSREEHRAPELTVVPVQVSEQHSPSRVHGGTWGLCTTADSRVSLPNRRLEGNNVALAPTAESERALCPGQYHLTPSKGEWSACGDCAMSSRTGACWWWAECRDPKEGAQGVWCSLDSDTCFCLLAQDVCRRYMLCAPAQSVPFGAAPQTPTCTGLWGEL